MKRATIDWAVLRDVTWWSWVAAIALLVLRFAGCTEAVYVAIALCLALTAYDGLSPGGDGRAMGVQIRVGYALLLALGLLPGMAWLHAVQLVGTSVRVACGYCLLERELRLLPWNRVDRLTVRDAWRTLTARPGAGGLIQLGGDRPVACALNRKRVAATAEATVVGDGWRAR